MSELEVIDRLPRPVGFEIEFCGEPVRLLSALQRRLTAGGYLAHNHGAWRRTQKNNDFWDLKLDSSCGCEAASPVITSKSDLRRHAQVVDFVKTLGGKIDEKCGLHVHVQVSDLDQAAVDRVMRFMTRYQPAFFLIAPASRINNRWCAPLDEGVVGKIKRAAGDAHAVGYVFRDNKNFWMNGQPINRIGTLEFRLMGGDITPDFVVGWVLLLQQAFANTAMGKKRVAWGEASAADNRMLLYTMLQQAGCYGKMIGHDKSLAVAARSWAIEQFNRYPDRVPPKKVKSPKVVDQTAVALAAGENASRDEAIEMEDDRPW